MYLGTFPLTGTFSLSLYSLFSILGPFMLIVLALWPSLNHMLLSLIPYRLTSVLVEHLSVQICVREDAS